jgi:hypothetical protein
MISHATDRPVSALGARMIEDMSVRGFSKNTRNDYIQNVRAFSCIRHRLECEGQASTMPLRRCVSSSP